MSENLKLNDRQLQKVSGWNMQIAKVQSEMMDYLECICIERNMDSRQYQFNFKTMEFEQLAKPAVQTNPSLKLEKK